MLYLKFVQWEKSCSYIAKQTAIDKQELIDNDAYNAKLIVNNPRGEKAIHYAIVKYIKMTYPHIVLTNSLAEHLDTHFARLISYHKRYQKGTPDIKLKCKIGDSDDVEVIEVNIWIKQIINGTAIFQKN